MKAFVLLVIVATFVVSMHTMRFIFAAQTAVSTKSELNEQEKRGESIYHRGIRLSGEKLTATVDEMETNASTLDCASCHGKKGEGKAEGGIMAGALVWPQLVKPEGHRHPSGRRHIAFDESSFARALTEGIDPDGNEFVAAMPRYSLTKEDAANLIAYLKRLGEDGKVKTQGPTHRTGK